MLSVVIGCEQWDCGSSSDCSPSITTSDAQSGLVGRIYGLGSLSTVGLASMSLNSSSKPNRSHPSSGHFKFPRSRAFLTRWKPAGELWDKSSAGLCIFSDFSFGAIFKTLSATWHPILYEVDHVVFECFSHVVLIFFSLFWVWLIAMGGFVCNLLIRRGDL